MTDALFTPLTAGLIEMKNRVVMAPLTRCRAYGLKPGALHVDYYRQRAGAGLIVSEGAQISAMGQGNADTPGIYTQDQIAAWREVTAAVHEAGGKIVIQLWHVGRISHEKVLGGRQPVAPSAIAARAKSRVEGASHATPVPRALTRDEIAATVEDYRKAAANAIAAGFDGVEIHGANGYLIDQFLRDSSNKRDDDYGGSIANRVRFLREVVSAVAAEIGPGRCGLRLSPWSNANDIGLDSDTPALFAAAIDVINAIGIAFLHVVEGQTGGPRDFPTEEMAALRQRCNAVWIANNGYDRDSAIDAVATGRADAIAFGRDYITNPDLAERLEKSLPLTPRASAGVYGGGAEGFTDYPALSDSIAD